MTIEEGLGKMITKMGNEFPEGVGSVLYANAIAAALRSELGQTHCALKTLQRWTDANERTTKNWLAGTHGPSGYHLIMLASHSEKVLQMFLHLAQRPEVVVALSLPALRTSLLQTVALLDEYLSIEPRAAAH